MQKVYSHPDTGMVHLVKNELEHHGIASVVRGEYLAVMTGMTAPVETWFELWVEDAARAEEAARVVAEVIAAAEAEVQGAPWECPACGEEGGAQLAVCWSCGEERPEEA